MNVATVPTTRVIGPRRRCARSTAWLSRSLVTP
jgi:hypothetical protein